MLFMLLHFNASQLSPDRFWEVLTCDVQHDDWIFVCVCVCVLEWGVLYDDLNDHWNNLLTP